MSLYVYAPVLQQGTKQLIDTLQAKRLMKHDGMHFLYKGTPLDFSPVDAIVCWGCHVPAPDKVPCLNSSVSYNSLLGLNVRGLMELSKAGYVTLPFTSLTKASYIDSLHTNDWPSRQPQSGYVSLREFEGYGTHYYKFESRDDVFVFQGKLLNDGKNELIQNTGIKALAHLKLDFGRISIGVVNQTPVVYQIQTGPALDTKGVKLFAKHIASWAKTVGEFNATAGNYEDLLK
jgi:hypothetical protein